MQKKYIEIDRSHFQVTMSLNAIPMFSNVMENVSDAIVMPCIDIYITMHEFKCIRKQNIY